MDPILAPWVLMQSKSNPPRNLSSLVLGAWFADSLLHGEPSHAERSCLCRAVSVHGPELASMRSIISEQREQDWGAKDTNVANVSLCGTSRHGAQPSVARFALRFDPEKFSAQFLLVFPRYIANGFSMLDTQLLFSVFLVAHWTSFTANMMSGLGLSFYLLQAESSSLIPEVEECTYGDLGSTPYYVPCSGSSQLYLFPLPVWCTWLGTRQGYDSYRRRIPFGISDAHDH